jgi:hypothetical protein
MNPHTPKWASTLGVGIPMDSWIFKKWLQGSKPIRLKSSLFHWKALGMQMSKMGFHDPFGYSKHKLWPKEGSRIKLPIWFLTTKSWEWPWFSYVQVVCHIPLESSQQGLQLCFRFTSIGGLHTKLWDSKVARVLILGILGLPFGSLRTQWHLGAGPMAKHRE